MPSTLAAIKDKLTRNRSLATLFDTSLYTRQLENLFERRQQDGASADRIDAEA